MRAHGGGLHVETEPGGGSRFCVYLPRSLQDVESVAREAPIESWRGSGTVVVVDDDEGVAAATARMLGELGFDPIVCRGGREAIASIFDARNDVALVLLDLMMPGLDGAATLRGLRAKQPHVRAVLMSGFHELAEPDCRRAGARKAVLARRARASRARRDRRAITAASRAYDCNALCVRRAARDRCVAP